MAEATDNGVKTRQRAAATLLPFWPRTYIPQLLWSIGQGGMSAVLAVAATSIGASTSGAALVVAMAGLGTVFFDLPAGRVIARFGEFTASWIATIIIAGGLIGAYFATTPVVLGIAVFVVSCGWGIWNLRVLTYLSRVAPQAVRGRALALIGGVSRTGNVIGPFILYGIAGHGSRGGRDSFLVFLIGALIGFVVLVVARDRSDHEAHRGALDRIHVFRLIGQNMRGFLTAATGTFGISLLRGSRQAILPLWGLHIGLSLGQIALIFGISSVLDVAFFYPSGTVSDRFGRKVVAVPCLTLLSIGHLLLPFTHGFRSLFLVALLLGFGNSLGSGIVMTLGADQAPAVGRASFLAVWRLVADSGTAAGPFLVGAVVAIASLTAAGIFLGLLGLLGAGVILFFMDDRARRDAILE